MSNLNPIDITHNFNGDSAAAEFVSASQLDTQLGNLAAQDNAVKAVLDRITDSSNNIAAQSVGQAQLKADVVAALDDFSIAVLQKTLLPAHLCVSSTPIGTPTGLPTIDGISVGIGARVLLTAQAIPSQNGSYIAAAGAWAKNTVAYPSVVQIDSGTLYQLSMWTVAADGITWSRITSSYTNQLATHMAATGTAVHGLGNVATRAVGTTAGTAAAGDDARFTDARTPTAHAASHIAAASDPLTGILDANARLELDVGNVLKGTRRKLNLFAGTDLGITAVDNPGNESVDVIINAIFPPAASNDMFGQLSYGVQTVSTSTYAFSASSFGKLWKFTNATMGIVSLPDATTYAGKMIGIEFVADSPANGYTLNLWANGTDTFDGGYTRLYLSPTNKVILLADTGVWRVIVKNTDTAWQGGNSFSVGATTTPPSFGTTTKNAMWWKRQGDSLKLRFDITQTGAGGAGVGTYLLTVPIASQSIDSTKLSYDSALTRPGGASAIVGHMSLATATANYMGFVTAYDSTRIRANLVGNASDDNWGAALGALSAAALQFSLEATLPMQYW